MKHAVGGLAAIAHLTLLEILRQRLWLLGVLGAIAILALVPGMEAVDESARLKLAVAGVTGTVGFIVTLVALLVGAIACRRDAEAKTAFTLFTKPLPRWAYLVGRWLGVQVFIALLLVVLGLAGLVAIRLQHGGLPQARQAVDADTWSVVEHGETVAIDQSRQEVRISGDPRRGQGQALRLRFTDLAPGSAELVLLRCQVYGPSIGRGSDRTPVQVSLRRPDGSISRLTLQDESPYGADRDHDDPHRILLRDRERQLTDLDRDYARVVLPADAVAADGSLLVQIDRLLGGTALGVTRSGGIVIAGPGQTFALVLFQALAVVWIQAGVLVAISLWLVGLAKIPVVLLGGLTIYFGGLVLPYLREAVDDGDLAQPLIRLLDLYTRIQPDFQCFAVEARLAAGQAIDGLLLVQAAGYYGLYIVLALAAGWWSLRRAEW